VVVVVVVIVVVFLSPLILHLKDGELCFIYAQSEVLYRYFPENLRW
jgi:hypothetical protein